MTILQPKFVSRMDWNEKPLSSVQISRNRAILAFMLRSWGYAHADIAAIMKLPSRKRARAAVAKGRRLFVDCIANTVAP